jgi:hypothetical protein
MGCSLAVDGDRVGILDQLSHAMLGGDGHERQLINEVGVMRDKRARGCHHCAVRAGLRAHGNLGRGELLGRSELAGRVRVLKVEIHT